MDKKLIISQLQAAKNAHIGWRIHAQAVVNGLNVDDKVPVLHTDCTFGKWYYKDGQVLAGLCSEFVGIETPHEYLHATYLQIHQQLFNDDYSPKLVTMKGNLRVFGNHDILSARKYLKELVSISDDLLARLFRLENQVKSSSCLESFEYDQATSGRPTLV